MEKDQTQIAIKRETYFYGKRKIGLDSCVLIDMIEYSEMLFYVKGLFKEKDLLHAHEICVEEVIKILSDKRTSEITQTKEEVLKFLKENNINIIKKDEENTLYKTIPIHIPDSFIIADWKKSGINLVYSQNNHFNEACNSIGINAVKIPTFEKLLEIKLRKLFKLSKKK